LEFLADYGLFLAKTLTFLVAFVVVLVIALSAGSKGATGEKGQLEITKLNDKFDDLADAVKSVVIEPEVLKAQEKEEKKKAKVERKKLKQSLKQKAKKGENAENESTDEARKRVFVLNFDGDIKASATEELREVITAVVSVATEKDEVVLLLESQGGMVHSYGLAASQLTRLTSQKIPLTVCVDKVAASGGYMMACVADKIISAPFAIIGSIGVVAQLPNFHRLLKKHDVDYEMLTAGKYKRTLTMLGENTEEGREKFREDLEDTHVLFKDFIGEHRAAVDVDAVATGEIWFGTRALENSLIDDIQTSDQYLYSLKDDADLYEVNFVQKKTVAEKLGINVESTIDNVALRWFQRFNNKIFS